MLDFHIVVLDCPYDTLHDPRTRDILNDTVQLKVDGFKTGYQYGVLPVDTADFIATHILMCFKYGERYLPVAGFKSITPQRSEFHRIQFPLLSLLNSSKANVHSQIIVNELEQADKKGLQARWDSSYTILPSLRKDRAITEHLKELFICSHVNFHKEFKSDIVYSSGVVKYKTDQFFSSWGYERIQNKGEDLPLISQYSLFEEQVRLMRLSRLDHPYALEMAEKFKDIWDNKTVISSKKELKLLKRAA
ncbi:hypothetical protein HBN50_02025 [Halobacteriovorax sp. GB3]|uniref:hypothetical protein n=1 Tax=Halobacteriovorax sp. GB3 TaxID=2719615 RepID=UPI00235F286C|nr:hypothetical protein [Halobacteriovorax sp. GB3]MDD0851849.1 hypothetical protein [Halobacteriovorax sp. GB3]